GLVIRSVRIGPSPEWLASRLRAVGLRPISNVVDATNYVLHELGHPLHAFDLDRLGDTVVVRRARRGERITTLDGIERRLEQDMLVIADAQRPVAIAGVMGGADTEVHDDTRNIMLECAVFDPRSIRSTRRALGLSTDASYRFERGVDPFGTLTAVARAVALIQATAGGEAEPAGAFAGSRMPDLPEITLELARVQQVLGIPFTPEQVAEYLRPLGFDVTPKNARAVSVRVPGHRLSDVSRPDDLVEEIARRHGYDAFPDDLRPFRPSSVPTHPLFVLEDRVRTLLVARGLLEARTAAFAPAKEGEVELMHPLAATESSLRRSLLPGLLRRVEYNFARGARSIRLFEIGTVFHRGDNGGLPRETTRLAIAITGPRHPPHWSAPAEPFDVWDLKSLVHDVAAVLDRAVEDDDIGEDAVVEPALSFRLVDPQNQAMVGRAGRVRQGAVDAPAWADDVWVLEADLVPSRRDRSIRFRELPQHP